METILITNEADSFRVTQKAFDVIYKNNGFKVADESASQSGDDENVRKTETEATPETAPKQVKKVTKK